ncbi:MAG: SusC/RagA family TonB-linked outer membrane protein [Paludibacter sp.]|nr:SusC/RagA family TonB-linked outer membrane protein [Paludibacter sp.]
MRKNNQYIGIALFFIFTLIFGATQLDAQNKRQKAARKVPTVEVKATVTNEKGAVVPNAAVTVGEGAQTYYTDKNGMFRVNVKAGSTLIIEALGYEPRIIDTSKGNVSDLKIVVSSAPLFAGVKDKLPLPGWMETTKRYNVGAISAASGTAIEKYPDMITANALQGKLLGLMSLMSSGGLANNAATLYIRGMHRQSGNNIVTLVDGVERDINTLIPEEIATIEVLKDATAKILYGPRAANGVLLITTKRGEKYKRVIKVNAEYGVGLPANMPDFVNSYDYARLYNEARMNDGLQPVYTAKDLEGYRNSTGANDFRYPNVDYYNYFLKKNTEYRKVDFEFSGGNENAQYSFVGGYNGTSGLQNIGKNPQRDRFNARGNLDIKVNDFISAFLGISGVFDVTDRSSLDHAQTFTALSTHRPNEYPIFIPESVLKPDSAGYPAFGTGINRTDNLHGSLMYGGYRKEQNINGQLNFGLNFDLNDFVKGLTAKAQVTFDNYFWGAETLTTEAPTYSQRWIQTPDGRDSLVLIMRKMGNKTDQMVLTNTTSYRTTSYMGALNYQRTFGDNMLNADYVYNYYLSEATGENQDMKFLNNVLRLNLVNQGKYIVEANVGYMGSNKFSGENKYTPSFAGGVGWILSEENFLKDNASVDYLKLKASAGLLAYDGQTAYNLYRDRWFDNGAVRFNNSLQFMRTNFVQVGNPGLKWEKSREINLGVEALLLNKKLWVEANYFNELRYDIIQRLDLINSMMYGTLIPSTNWGKVLNQGVEVEAKYSDRVDQLFYQVGANLIFSKNKVLQTDEINYPEDYMEIVGQPSDAMFGYVSKGLFGKDVDMSQPHSFQTFGDYQEGDIAYEDLNEDGMVDDRDRQILSNSFPRTHLGIDLNLNYKGFGLYVQGTAQLGFSNWLNNSYYWNRGEEKYSAITLDRYHPTENPNGTYPRLTTTDGSNNFRNSSFWIEKGDFFRIKNVELSYTLTGKQADVYRSVKFFARGTNLLLLSKNKMFDPEVMTAGLNNYPVLKNITGGISLSF